MKIKTHPFGAIRDGKIFLNSFREFPEREIGEVKESEESTLKYFEERFAMVDKKVKEIEEAIQTSENKGSYLMKLIHLKETLQHFDGLGDYEPLYKKLEVLENQLHELIAHNREKNLEIKNALIQEATSLKDTHDFKAGAEKFKELRDKWIRTGSVGKVQEEEMEKIFNTLKDDFFARRKAFFDDRKLMIQSRVQQYEDIINILKKSVEEDELEVSIKKIKSFQEKWKNIGEVPSKISKDLWNQLRNITDPAFEKYKILKKSRKNNSQTIEENLKIKEQIIDKAEALFNTPANQISEKINKLQIEWKNSGSIPKGTGEEISEKFYLACDKARELIFLSKLAQSKNKGFNNKPTREQLIIKINLLRDLLFRDEKDLELFNENIQKFSSGANSFNQLVHMKLFNQQKKVKVKQLILSQFNAQFTSLSEKKNTFS
ncbi:hypothetical protein BH23BAC1_BH23BAC1_16930 [soil metagenome]